MLLRGNSRELFYLTTRWGRAISVQLTFYGPDFQFGFNGTPPSFFLLIPMHIFEVLQLWQSSWAVTAKSKAAMKHLGISRSYILHACISSQDPPHITDFWNLFYAFKKKKKSTLASMPSTTLLWCTLFSAQTHLVSRNLAILTYIS